MKRLTILVALTASATGRAEQDPLEVASIAQARTQAKDATLVADFFKGQGEKTDYQVLLEGNKCYWFSGTSEGLEKLYMYLWTPGAKFFTPRVADARTTGRGTMAYCTTQSGMYKFQVKTEGNGRFVIGLFAKDAPRQVAPPEEMMKTPDLGPSCDRTASVAARGARRIGDFFDGKGSSIGHDDRIDYAIHMESGRCYWVIGCGEPDRVKALYLYLWGPDNKRITEAKSDTPNPMIGHCARETGIFKVQAKMADGKGYYKVGVYSK